MNTSIQQYDLLLKDGTNLGKISLEGLNAIKNGTLDSYLSKEWERDTIYNFKEYMIEKYSMYDLGTSEKPTTNELIICTKTPHKAIDYVYNNSGFVLLNSIFILIIVILTFVFFKKRKFGSD